MKRFFGLTFISPVLTKVCNKSLLSHVSKMAIDFLLHRDLAVKSRDRIQTMSEVSISIIPSDNYRPQQQMSHSLPCFPFAIMQEISEGISKVFFVFCSQPEGRFNDSLNLCINANAYEIYEVEDKDY